MKDKNRTKKLINKFIGPFPIRSKVNSTSYELALPSNFNIHSTFHVSLLKRYQSDQGKYPNRDQDFTRPGPEWVNNDGEEDYEVESILKKRVVRNKIQYLVKWLGYPEWEATWQSEADLVNSPNILRQFNSQQTA